MPEQAHNRGNQPLEPQEDLMKELHPSTEAILKFFEYDHLPPHLQSISEPFYALAHTMARSLDGPELTAGLRLLLMSKDCMVRAAL